VLSRWVAIVLYLALEDIVVAAIAADIRACRYCRPVYRVCAAHRRMLDQLPPCPDPECPACRPT
jgi:hypothetical protein